MKHGIDLDEVDGDRRWYRRNRGPNMAWFDFLTLEEAVKHSEDDREFALKRCKHGEHLAGWGTIRPASSADDHEILPLAWNCLRDKDKSLSDQDLDDDE